MSYHPSSPAPNALPSAYPTWPSLILSALHPQLLILYAYFALIATLLHRVVFKSMLAERLSGRERGGEVAIWLLLALISLGSTWTYMLRYFLASFQAWLSRANLTSLGVPHLPTCELGTSLLKGILTSQPCHLSLAGTHLQRISLWLSNTSLFLEAWYKVVENEANYWWSLEVCLYTVGAWTIFLHTQHRRIGIPQLWAYMILGQTVAISVAACLFNVALALRPLPEGSLVQTAALRGTSPDTALPGQVLEVQEEVITEEIVEGEEELTASASAVIKAQTAKRTTITQHLIQAPSTHPSLASRLLLWCLSLLAAFSLKDRPNTALSIATMHLLPVLLTAPHQWLHRLEEVVEHRILRPKPESEDEAAVHASNARLRGLLRPSSLLAILAGWGLAMKFWTTLTLSLTLEKTLSKYELVQLGQPALLRNLIYPITFHSHPAQSSISSDAVCLAAVTIAFIVLDVVRLPESIPRLEAASTAGPETQLQKKDSRPSKSESLSFTWCPRDLTLRWYLPAIVLILVTPLVGPMTTFPAWLAIRERQLEEAELQDEQRLRAEAGEGVGLVVKERVEEIVYTRPAEKRE